MNRFFIVVAVLTCYSITSVAQQAESAENDLSALEEVVVTAKQRSQNLQEVPLSISVFNANQLEVLGIDDIQTLANYTPNFNIFSGNGRQDASAMNVRGLSANTSDERYQPVAFFVDGIFMGGVTVGLQTVDVERIEVIKGPQSATFGRSTYAGAIDFVTKTPSLTEFSGTARAQVSSNTWDSTNVITSFSMDGPIVKDKLSGSIFLQYDEKGSFDQVPGGQFKDIGAEETKLFNGVLFAQLTANTTAKFRAIYAKENDQEAMYHTTQPMYWEQQGSNIVTLPTGALFIQGSVPDPIRNGIRGVDLPSPPIARPANGGAERERKFASLIVEHTFGAGFELSYRGSYLSSGYDANFDFRGRTLVGVDPIFGPTLPLQPGESSFNFRLPFPYQEEFEETSHQVRIVSPDNQLRWAAGMYYYDSRDSNYQKRSDLPAPEGNPAYQTRGDENIDNFAIFGSIAYDLSEKFTLSGEGRWQTETVDFESLLSSVSTGSRIDKDVSAKENNFEPRVTLEYRPNQDHMFYALYAQGVKSGRWNTTTALPLGPDGTRPAKGYIYAPPETLNNFELGSKSTLLDGRMILNAALFYQQIEDQQLRQTVFIDEDFNGDGDNDQLNAVFTAGDSEISGFEVEMQYLATENILVNAALGYADHEFVDDIEPAGDFDLFDYLGKRSLKGKTSVNVPRVTAIAGIQYTQAAFGNKEWMLRGDVIYTGKKYVDLANLASIPDYYLLNLRSSLEADNWSLTLFVNNLLDDETALGAQLTGTAACEYRRNGPNLPAYNNAQTCIYLVPQRGREVGLNMVYRF